MTTNAFALGLCALALAGNAHAHTDDDPLVIKTLIDTFAVRTDGNTQPLVVEAQLLAGTDLHKAVVTLDLEQKNKYTEELEVQLLYSRAISAFWNLQTGVRQDLEPYTNTWGVLGVQGLAPGFVELNASLFASGSGDTAARIEAEYELPLTQQFFLVPEIELNFHGQNKPHEHMGSGLSDMHLGLRLSYSLRPELEPYIGVGRERAFGKTAELHRTHGDDHNQSYWHLGISAWF